LKIISLFGYSGSGKTYFITRAIKKLKQEFNIKVAVIKNIHQHRIDEKGKDSYLFSQAGAQYSIIKNEFEENAIFFKNEVKIDELIKWIESGPLKVDLIFTEGFRQLPYPAILCVKEFSEIEQQLSSNVKMISGFIVNDVSIFIDKSNIPIVDINKDFRRFLKIFNIN
jgi:molybdopterin-guanine dinucleotide biosynthesis protein B